MRDLRYVKQYSPTYVLLLRLGYKIVHTLVIGHELYCKMEKCQEVCDEQT